VLGCTHYPLLAPLLARVAERRFGRPIALVDSAQAMARAVERRLAEEGLAGQPPGGLSCFVTDEARFAEVASRFLGRPLEKVEKVDL
jgi:glutamate racemase